MKVTLRAWLLAGFAVCAGCASTGEQRGLSLANLPSPWATMKKSPAASAADDKPANPSLLSKLTGSKAKPAKSKVSDKDQEAIASAMLRGRNHERAGEWDKARETYESVRPRDPESAEIAHRLGIVADAQRRHGEAELLFQFALQRQPQNATVLSDLGYCYFLQGQLSKAESAILKATKLDPESKRHSNNMGLVLGHQGRYEEALACFRKGGSEGDAQYNLAFIYAAQEKADQAKGCFELALAADPQHRRAREALSSFEEFERLPQHLRDLDDLAENGVRYVPYVEGADKGGVAQASAVDGIATSVSANRAAQALHTEARGMLNRNMSSQRADDMAGK